MEILIETNEVLNPISHLVNDDLFIKLKKLGLLNEKLLRDFEIKQKYQQYRKQKINASTAIDLLQEEYPYLQYDTIRKIVYSNIYKTT